MKYILILLFVTISLMSYAQEQNQSLDKEEIINIPDINFEKALIKKGIEEGEPDGKILLSKIENIETLDLAWTEPPISDLTGIEHFKNLKILLVEANDLTELNTSKNSKLETLSCGGNEKISSLDLSKNIALKRLFLYDHDAGSSNIKSIDLSANINLRSLHFDSYLIEDIDLSHNTQLKELFCQAPWGHRPNHGLLTLDLSNNILLEKLNCYGNQLKYIDLSNNLQLKYLACSDNQLIELNLKQNKELEELSCSRNNLSYLDCSQNLRLKKLWCSKDLSKCLAISPATAVYYYEEEEYQFIKVDGLSDILKPDCLD